MTTLFISYARENAICAEQIEKELEKKGYNIWRKPPFLSPQSILYPMVIENGIVGSAAMILVWSNTAAASEWVERHIHLAQSLKKLIIPVMVDETPIPNTLVDIQPIISHGSCSNIVASFITLLPPFNSSDSLILLTKQMAHEHISVRKEALDQAAKLLQRDEHRESVLALLEYVSQNDTIKEVRDKAKDILDANTKKDTVQSVDPDESRHMFGVRCKNNHVSYFDKRLVCSASSPVVRGTTEGAGLELDELHLTCQHQGCGLELVARVDCRDYR